MSSIGIKDTAHADEIKNQQSQEQTEGGENQDASKEHAPRRVDATWKEIFSGPFPSSRLFAMPTARVIGAYQLSMSGDASLLGEADTLSTTSVVAIGFGDIAQLEYRSSTAMSTLRDIPIRLPTLGVQLAVPYRHPYLPELAVALRFGLPRTELSPDERISHTERVTDLYFVGSKQLTKRLSLHGGLRVSSARISSSGEPLLGDADQVLYLPAGGLAVQITEHARIAAETSLVPLFAPGDATRESRIGSGVFGRTGIHWRLFPWLVMEASIGYRIEVDRFDSSLSTMANALVDWDMRLGGEIFIPWGAVMCRGTRVFCE